MGKRDGINLTQVCVPLLGGIQTPVDVRACIDLRMYRILVLVLDHEILGVLESFANVHLWEYEMCGLQ